MSYSISSAHADVRESMRVLPGFLQPFLTWLTCKPLPEEESWNLRAIHHLVSSVLPLVLGVGIGIVAVTLSGFWLLLLPVGWLLTVHAIRMLRSVVVHQCAHSNFLASQRVNDFIGEAVSVVTLTQNYLPYKREHITGHHSVKHMTVDDPTVAFLLRMVGVRAGMSRDDLWSLMLMKMFSPAFHLRFMGIRLLSNVKDASTGHIASVVLFWGSLLAVTAATGTWMQFLLAWMLPLTILLHMAECLRLSGKHCFPEPVTVKRGQQQPGAFTHGIFVGERVPESTLPPLRKMSAWAVWWLRLFVIHLPSRMLVLVGDAPCHDYHHRRPKAKDWSNYIFARQKEVVSLPPGAPPFTEVWGVAAAIDATFHSLTVADPSQYTLQGTHVVTEWELLAALEE